MNRSRCRFKSSIPRGAGHWPNCGRLSIFSASDCESCQRCVRPGGALKLSGSRNAPCFGCRKLVIPRLLVMGVYRWRQPYPPFRHQLPQRCARFVAAKRRRLCLMSRYTGCVGPGVASGRSARGMQRYFWALSGGAEIREADRRTLEGVDQRCGAPFAPCATTNKATDASVVRRMIFCMRRFRRYSLKNRAFGRRRRLLLLEVVFPRAWCCESWCRQ